MVRLNKLGSSLKCPHKGKGARAVYVAVPTLLSVGADGYDDITDTISSEVLV